MEGQKKKQVDVSSKYVREKRRSVRGKKGMQWKIKIKQSEGPKSR